MEYIILQLLEIIIELNILKRNNLIQLFIYKNIRSF